ncbi:MAG: sugar phosphate isomerase/epimerase family protein [Candidatus Cyclobacteriaceae bacterium M3_2C_046]
MTTRRSLLKILGLAGAAAITPMSGYSRSSQKALTRFKYCLNTSTISGQKPGLIKYIDIAAEAGYDGVELWVRDVKAYLDQGNSANQLKRYIEDKRLSVENAIGFAPWMMGEEGFNQMRQEMKMMGAIGCKRIAAPAAGVPADQPLDLFKVGQLYRQLIDLGKETGVMPQLEFWGASPVFYHFGQALMVAGIANHPDVRLLPDIYHLFRGDSGFNGLKMLQGHLIEVFHLNDYPSHIPREQQKDADRVYPGDGVAPIPEVLKDLAAMGGTKVLSIELFNRSYWEQDPLQVAKTGLQKMKKLTSLV